MLTWKHMFFNESNLSKRFWNFCRHHVLAIGTLIALYTLTIVLFVSLSRNSKIVEQAVLKYGQYVYAIKTKDGELKNTIIPKLTGELNYVPDIKCNMDKYLGITTSQCISLLNKNINEEVTNSRPIQENYTMITNRGYETVKSILNVSARYTDCDINSVFFDCNDLRYSYLYGKQNVTEEEMWFPLAFAMKIHNTPNQAHRLLRYIYQKHNLYCIHVDSKSSVDNYNMFKQISKCFDNIIVIEDRVNVIYASIRIVDAEIKCMTAMIKRGHKWKYYINLAGQEFMLKTNLELVKILKLLNGTNDVQSEPTPPEITRQRHSQSTYIIGNHLLRTTEQRTPIFENVEIRKGSTYGLFARKFVEFMLTEKLVKRLYSWLNDTLVPDEHIWATLNHLPQAPGGDNGHTISSRSLISRAVKWQPYSECGGKFVRDVCIYGTKDIPWLLSSPNVVANKFYENFQSLAIDCVENEMYSRLMSGDISNYFNSSDYVK